MVMVLVTDGLQIDVHGILEFKEAQGGDRTQPRLRRALTDRGDVVGLDYGALLGVERLRDRLFEPRQIRGEGRAAKARTRSDKLRQVIAESVERVRPRRVRG